MQQPMNATNLEPHSAVLNNPDILEEIFENLEVDHVWELEPGEVVARRRVLASVALTCRAFLEPALDRLWRSLDKLFPLFKLLPAFYRSDTTYVLRGTISDEDWARFDWYARRVKTFSYTRDPDSLDIAMHVYFRIAQLRRQPLLPCLRHLRCPHISQDDFLISSICLFLTPSLTSLEFEKITGVEDKLVGTFLHTLMCEGARVRMISLAGEGLTRDTLGYLGQCRYLKRLMVSGMGGGMDVEMVKAVGMIPGLTKLELDLEGSVVPDLLVNMTGGGGGGGGEEGVEGVLGFRELTSLELVAPLSCVRDFVMRIGTTQLRQIGFESSTEASVDRKELLGYVVRRWKETLVEVRMVHEDAGEDDDGGGNNNNNNGGGGGGLLPALSMDTISPLLPLSGLTHLELEGYSMELTDEDVGDIAGAWPNLESLQLPFMPAGTRRPSVGSLRVLADKCVRLRHLTIALDTVGIVRQAEEEGSRLSLHGLETLSIASVDDPWELRDALVLARFVDHLFPFLARVTGAEGMRDGGRWQQVHEMIQMYQAVRAEAVVLCRHL